MDARFLERFYARRRSIWDERHQRMVLGGHKHRLSRRRNRKITQSYSSEDAAVNAATILEQLKKRLTELSS